MCSPRLTPAKGRLLYPQNTWRIPQLLLGCKGGRGIQLIVATITGAVLILLQRILIDGILPSSRPVLPGPVIPANSYQKIAPFVFDSIHGLLKQWPNSFASNGHAIVLGTVSPNTILYHAQKSLGPPRNPIFYAFDPEMSVGIHGGSGHANLHVHGTTRPLTVIYFDGQSAALTAAGTLDTQMVLLQGRVPHYPSYQLVYNENQRALDLCNLVIELGIDGVIRMDAGFEVLVCDPSASQVRELFVTNITVPGNQDIGKNYSLPQDPNRQPPKGYGNVFSNQGSFEWLRSATWHYDTAELRVKPDLCRMISFYDPALTSLLDSHHGVIDGNVSFMNGWGLRRGHRLFNIDTKDVQLVRSWLRDFPSKPDMCSGIDWVAIVSTIRAQHGSRARELMATFNWKVKTGDQAHAIVTKIHELTHAILVPYLQYRPDPESPKGPKEWALDRCKSVYTTLADPGKLVRSELLIYHSINAVMKKLCDWEWELFEWSENRTTAYLGVQNTPGHLSTHAPTNIQLLEKEISQYHKRTTDTLTWIGWDTWSQCDDHCEVEELCAIPMWPVIYAPGMPQGGIYAATGPNLTEGEMREFWRPKCVSRADMDRGGGRGREPAYQFPDVDPGTASTESWT